MKILIPGLMLAALIATPAAAQSYDPDIGSGNIVPAASRSVSAEVLPVADRAPQAETDGAFAWSPDGAPPALDRSVPGAKQSLPGERVYNDEDGTYGADPDARIRTELNRESEEQD